MLRGDLKSSLLAIFLFASFVTVTGKRSVFAESHLHGDWIVTGTESYYDEVFVLNGNLIVENGGNLTFSKVTLKMNCSYDGQYNITVKEGGSLYILDDSIITSANPECEYTFVVLDGSAFRMDSSELHECGWPGGWGLEIQCSEAVIENSVISNNTEGITTCRDGVIIRNNNIIANEHIGIAVFDGNATIYNNYISGSSSGFELYSSPTLYNNTITLNGAGIGLDRGHPIIRDNVITMNDENGITFFDGARPTITGNNITANAQRGILSKGQCSGIIEGNMITRNSGGIEIGHDCNISIQGNVITANSEFGIWCYDNSTLEIHWNDIYGNGDYDVKNDDPSMIANATYNYWRDEPSTSSHVLYDSWLTESICPSTEIASPLIGELVSSTVTISTEVDAPNGVHKVEFYLDDEVEYTDYDLPYEWNWDTTQYTETEHKITAKAQDMFGLKISASITVIVDNTAPTVSIKEPASESTYYAVISVSVNATDNQEIGNVHVKVDNTEWLVMTYDPADLLWKYDFNTTLLSDGEHTLMTLALDKASNPATTSITLFTDNTPPSLTIQSPQSGITVALALSISVQASDSAGISRVEFYVQNALVCTMYETPFQWSWDTTKYPNGEYTIAVKAYDTIGNAKTSQTDVTVNNIESPWWQTHFWTIIQVLIGIGGLMVAILAYLTRTREEKKKK